MSTTHDSTMTAIDFAQVARTINRTAAQLGLEPVAYRSPCPVAASRSYRRSGVVSIDRRGRGTLAVIVDMVAGVLHHNDAVDDTAARDALLAATNPH